LLISTELKIHWGRFHLDLFYNPAHTMSMLNVDIPEADLIHVGDTLVGNMVYFKYSYPAAFFPAFEKIKERGRRRLLSSHAGVRDITAVDSAGYYLGALQLESSRAWQDESEDSILKIKLRDCLPDGVPATPFENIFHKRNLKTILERRYFEPETFPGKKAV
jgi:glyoxylase-like metal-dependent hydrolase (beta-lactamase superfamily II)